jgi:uncharacterized membrane protein
VAGIGIELRRLSARHSISAPIVSLGHAAWVSSGPLVLTATGLLVMSSLSVDYVSAREFSIFGVLLTYATALALVTSAPVAMIVTRLVADCIYLRREADIPSLLVAGLAIAAGLAGVAGGIFWCTLHALPARVSVLGFMLSQSIALLWVAAVFCGTLRDYTGVTMAFLAGILLAVATAVVLAAIGLDAAAMIFSMMLGNMTTTLALAARVLLRRPRAAADFESGLRSIGAATKRFPLLVAGAIAGTVGMWIDKWVIWCSSQGQSVVAHLSYAPLYDNAMFTSFLFIVPSLASFIIYLETGLQFRLARLMSRILGSGTLGEIEHEAERLGATLRASMFHLLLIQAAVTAFAILALPLIVAVLGMPFRQIPIMRFGLLGSVFHLLFLLCCSVLLFVNRQRAYCVLQFAFLVLSGLLTAAGLGFGPDVSGMGYFAAAMICGVAAYLWLDRTLRDLIYLTFASADANPGGAPRGDVRWPQKPAIT